MKTFCRMVVVLVLLSVAGCGFDSVDLAHISKMTKLRFPPSTRLLHGENQGLRDLLIVAKMSMNKSDVNRFLASVPGKSYTLRTCKLLDNSDFSDLKWWNPDSAKKFVSLRSEGPRKQETFDILVSLDDPHRAIVYLQWGRD